MNLKEDLTNTELKRYKTQIALPEFGFDGQKRLKESKVLVVGAGGLGCPCLLYLCGAGVGTIGIVDFDTVEESNLHRQVLFGTKTQGKIKAEVSKERLFDLNPNVKVEVHSEKLTATNAERIFRAYDIVVDGTDNFAARYLINDTCVVVEKPFVSGAIFKFEGQVSVFNAILSDGSRGPTYRCLFPSPPPAELVPSCAEMGVLGVLPGLVGIMQATEVIKVLTGLGDPLIGKLLHINILKPEFRVVSFQRDNLVVSKTRILSDTEYKYLCAGGELMKLVREITPIELKSRLDKGDLIELIDVREPFEREICHIGGKLIPLASLASKISEIPKDKEVIVYCRSGGRSHNAVSALQMEYGFDNLLNLNGGMLRWIDDVDPALPKY